MKNDLPYLPPEWAPQDQLMIGWPSHFAPWDKPFEAAREEIAELALVILSTPSRTDERPTGVTLVVDGKEAEAAARKAVPGAGIINTACGDTWLRDTGPILAWQGSKLIARSFGFNGWGNKYIYPGDEDLSVRLSEVLGAKRADMPFILEGGSVDWDGAGHILTTDECLLNENRNPGWSREDAEAALKSAFGVSDVIWIAQGLLNDHTDGHIDNLARFVAPGHVVCQSASTDDPHKERLNAVEAELRSYRNRRGEALSVTTIPSPGSVMDEDGEPVPASHMNFVITNQAVIVPAYNDRAGLAVKALSTLFPARAVLSRPASATLTGGGSFHCISQQIPAKPKE
jgi:agmatine deiminase